MCEHEKEFTCESPLDETQKLKLENEILRRSMAIIQDGMLSQRIALDSSLSHVNKLMLQIVSERTEIEKERTRLYHENLKVAAERIELANAVKQLAMLSFQSRVRQ